MFDLINELNANGVEMRMSPSEYYKDGLHLRFRKDNFQIGYIIKNDQLEFFKDELAGLFYDFFERFMGDYNRQNCPKID